MQPISFDGPDMTERIPDREYAENVKKVLSKLVGRDIKLSVITHDSRRIIPYEGKILQIGNEYIAFESSRTDISIPVIDEEKIQIRLVDVHSFVSEDKVTLFIRNPRKLNRY